MLEPPALDQQALLAMLQSQYALPIDAIAFLPLGADVDTAVYRGQSTEQRDFFIKLRCGPFNLASMLVPAWLHQQVI